MGWADAGLTGAATGSALGPWGAAAGFLVGAGGAIIGANQKKKGNALMNSPYPNMPIPKEILDNQERAKMAATEGLPSQVYQNAMKNIQRNTNSAIRTATNRRGGLGLVGTINREANDAMGNLDMADAKQIVANRNQLYDVNNQVAGWRNRQWDWNQRQKYQRDYDYGLQLVGAGNANQGNAFDTILSSAALFGASGGFGKKKETTPKTKTTASATSTSPIGSGSNYIRPNYIF